MSLMNIPYTFNKLQASVCNSFRRNEITDSRWRWLKCVVAKDCTIAIVTWHDCVHVWLRCVWVIIDNDYHPSIDHCISHLRHSINITVDMIHDVMALSLQGLPSSGPWSLLPFCCWSHPRGHGDQSTSALHHNHQARDQALYCVNFADTVLMFVLASFLPGHKK